MGLQSFRRLGYPKCRHRDVILGERMQTVDSLEKTLMVGEIEGRRRRG